MDIKVRNVGGSTWTTLPKCKYDGGYTPEIYDIQSDDSGRDNTGYMHIDLVATKRKLNLEWSYISSTDVATILTAIQNVFFEVQYQDLDGTTQTGVFYKGDRSAPLYTNSGGTLYSSFTVNLIER